DFSWIRIQTDSRMNGFSLKKGDLLLVRHSSSASEGDSVVIRDFGKNFQLAKCQMDGVTGKTFLTTGTRRLENSNAKVFGILVFMIRFKF
ncbi:MAG: S24 family peptidase, partial [Thermoguttaceae bacterium]|nr:S24 family peptidase [Thermoguttaceae bacterium]